MRNNLFSEEIKSKILNTCKDLAGSGEAVAACLYGPRIYESGGKEGDANVLLVITSPQPILKSHKKTDANLSILFLIVDQRTFEKDVESGWLGELTVENIITPYLALLNEEYLQRQEVKAKKRLISELICNLALEFPELSYDLFIRPEYFMFETISRMASLFPPVGYGFFNMLRRDRKGRSTGQMMKGFEAALTELAEGDQIDFCDGYVKIKKDWIDAVKARRTGLITLFRSLRKEAFRQIFKAFPKTMLQLLMGQETYSPVSVNIRGIIEEPLLRLEDSKRYIFVRTPLGFVALSDKTTIEDFVKKAVPEGGATEMDIKKIGGVLNSVYLLTFRGEHQKQKVVVKLFKDWYGLKWFPLALWAIGTRELSVLGKSRLEKEYAINQLLSSRGICVPEILFVSPKERLIFQRFVEGENLVDILRRFGSRKMGVEEINNIFKDVGKTIAKVHAIGVAMGDCKPENVVITPREEVCFLDLEQASRGGDQAWDIAEFLLYSGHCFPLLSSLEDSKIMTRAFVDGYLEEGGNIYNVRKAGSARYAKVFSFFTPPHVLIAISSTYQKILRTKIAPQK